MPKTKKQLIDTTLSRFDQSELVLALVCPVGVDYERCIHVLQAAFERLNYIPKVISMSSLMDNLCKRFSVTAPSPPKREGQRIRSRMELGNSLREKTQSDAILALAAIQEINRSRAASQPSLPIVKSSDFRPLLRIVHILATLKRPEEADILRKVYGTGFFLIGIHDSERGRKDYLVDQKGIEPPTAVRLMGDDEDDNLDFGQRTRETYHLADVFISLRENGYKEQLTRFVDLIFGNTYHTPTRDEYAMYLASASSLRSAQLGRQVGAAIVSKSGDLISVGCNDVPRAGGGLYWVNDKDDKRSYVRRGL